MKDARNTRHLHRKLSSSNELFPLMREEFIEIVDEIAGEFPFRFYDEVRRVLDERNAPAAASKPDMTIINSSDSEQDQTFPDADAEITDGDRKPAASEITPDKHRKEAAKVMASLLPQNPTLHDTERQEALKEPPKKANEAQSKKRKILPILPGTKQRRGKKHYKQKSNGIPNPKDETICHAGLECCLGDIDVVVEGNGSNGSLCSKCQQTFHFVCLHRFEEDKYCTDCYKEHVVSQCETGTLFGDLLQSKETAKAQTGPTHTESDLVKHVDNYLKALGMPLTLKQ
jgi:hypothetical protein